MLSGCEKVEFFNRWNMTGPQYNNEEEDLKNILICLVFFQKSAEIRGLDIFPDNNIIDCIVFVLKII